MLIKTPLLHQSSGPRAFLSLSLRLFLWSAEALWVQFPAWASKTLPRRCSAPSPHREGTWGLHEQSKPREGALLAFWVNQGISASFSLLYFLIGRLWTTRFRSIKGPQHPWTGAHQAPLSMGSPRQQYWSGLPFPPPGGLPNPGIEPESRASSLHCGQILYHFSFFRIC